MLRHTIFFALLGMAATAVGQTPRPCQVRGTIRGLGSRPVVFVYQQQGRQHRDTVRASNDQFAYAAKPSDDGTFYLKITPNFLTMCWYEPGTLAVTGTLAAPTELAVRGTPDNEATTQYNQQTGWPFAQRTQAHRDSAAALQRMAWPATEAFIKGHPQRRISADLLYWQTIQDEQPVAAYTQLINALAPAVQASAQGRAVAKRLAVLRSQPVVGRPAPVFTIADTAGVAVPLSRFRGQYVLLDFWGHWCGPCVQSLPHLKQLQAQYAQRLAVVGIAMEKVDDKRLWLQAIRNAQAHWTQLSELQGTAGVIEQYNVTGFPTYLLLDPQGVVVARSGELGPIETQLHQLVPAP